MVSCLSQPLSTLCSMPAEILQSFINSYRGDSSPETNWPTGHHEKLSQHLHKLPSDLLQSLSFLPQGSLGFTSSCQQASSLADLFPRHPCAIVKCKQERVLKRAWAEQRKEESRWAIVTGQPSYLLCVWQRCTGPRSQRAGSHLSYFSTCAKGAPGP